MTVFVDDMNMRARVANGAKTVDAVWCHMTADTSEELLEMAEKIGLNPRWIQYPGTWKEHFDVTASRRRKAVLLGAVEVSWRDRARAARQQWKHRDDPSWTPPSSEATNEDAMESEDLMSVIEDMQQQEPLLSEEVYTENVYAQHILCAPYAPKHECYCHISPPCEPCFQCPSFSDEWNGWGAPLDPPTFAKPETPVHLVVSTST